MQVKSIAECSKGSILQYFRPSLSYHLSYRAFFCLFLSGRFTQVLLYNGGGKLDQESLGKYFKIENIDNPHFCVDMGSP